MRSLIVFSTRNPFRLLLALSVILLTGCRSHNSRPRPDFNVLAFYTGKADPAHISFVREANRWFTMMAEQHHFTYRATTNWNELDSETLARCQVVLFLDTRPDVPAQR